MSKTNAPSIALLAALIAPAALVGCNAQEDVSYGAISGNLTPEMQGSTERSSDVDRNIKTTADFNGRLLSDDLGRAFYTDHPSRLSPLPVNGTSGNPR